MIGSKIRISFAVVLYYTNLRSYTSGSWITDSSREILTGQEEISHYLLFLSF